MNRPRPHIWRVLSAMVAVVLLLAAGSASGIASPGVWLPPAGRVLLGSAQGAPRAAAVGGSSYLGGTGTDNVNAVAVDDQGNTYVTGYTESPDFPTAGALQSNLVGDDATGVKNDAFVAKINPEGTALVWSTFLGGKGREAGDAIAVAGDGSVFVTGYTESEDFPVAKPFQAAYGGGPSDAFVAKIRPDGSGLEYSSYLGGRGTDGGKGLTLDAGGSAYVTGSTASPNFASVNSLPGAVSAADDVDAFVVKVIPAGSGVQYATRLGGTSDDHGTDLAVDGEGSAYVTGDTRSPGFPTLRPLQVAAGGTASGTGGSFSDAFVTKLSPSGASMVYSTFLGGSDSDQGAGIDVDAAGSAYVTGNTRSTDFPTASPVQGGNEGDVDAFVSKLNPDGSSLVYSTYFGGGAADGGVAVAVDGSGGLLVTGSTGSTNLPTARPLQPANGGGLVDAFLARFNPAGSVPLSSTYLGGTGDDQGSAVAVDRSGQAHVVGYTNSPNLPASSARGARSVQPRLSGGVDGFVMVVAEGAGGTGRRVAIPAEGGTSSGHDRRVRVLTGMTLALFLLALAQTLYLRRRDGGGHGWRPSPKTAPASDTTRTMAEPVAVVPATTPRSSPAAADQEAGSEAPADTSPPDNPWLAGALEAPDQESFLPPVPVATGAPSGGLPDGDPGPPSPDLSFWDLFPDGPPAPPDPPDPPGGDGGLGPRIPTGVDDRLQNLLSGFTLTGSRPTDSDSTATGFPEVRKEPDSRPAWLSSLDDFARGGPPPTAGAPTSPPPLSPPPLSPPPRPSPSSPPHPSAPAADPAVDSSGTRVEAADLTSEGDDEGGDEAGGDGEGDGDAEVAQSEGVGRRRGSAKRRPRRSGRRRRPNDG